MNEKIDAMINAVGALAEFSAELYRQLVRSGFDQGDALSVVKEVMIEMMFQKRSKGEE